MKIGLCVRTWGDLGGIGEYTRFMVTNLLQIDKKNEYFLFYKNKGDINKFNHLDNVHEILIESKSKFVWDQIHLPIYIRKNKLDVILHTKLAIPLLKGAKTVMLLHGTERFFYKNFHPWTDRLFFRAIYPLFFKRTDIIIADANRAREDVIQLMNFDPCKIKVVYLASQPIYRQINDQVYLNRIKIKYNLPDNYILNVGGLYPGKNIGRLIQAFSNVKKEQMGLKLIIAGFLRYKFMKDLEMIKLLNLEDEVIFLGYVPNEDLVGIYNLARLTAFPSFYECFPAIPLEANACGCPVVTSYTGGTPEAAGDAAYYIDPLDVDNITHGIRKVLSDIKLREDLIKKGFKNVQRFSWQKTAQETLNIIESLNSDFKNAPTTT